VRILPCVLACLCLQRWTRFGVWCRHGGVVAKGWVIAKLLRGGFDGVSVVVTVGNKAPRAQLFCLLSPYGRQVSPRDSTALDLHIYPSLQLPASSQVLSSASCCIASCYIHVTIKSSTVLLRQVSPSGTVLARCSSDSSAVTCSIIVASASACLLLLRFCCLVPSHALHRPSNPSRQDRASQAKSSLIRSARWCCCQHIVVAKAIHCFYYTASYRRTLSVKSFTVSLRQVLRLAQAVVSPRALSSVVAVSL